MDRRIFHGNIHVIDIAQALLGEFDQGNLRAQMLDQGNKILVQIGTRQDRISGGQTAMTVTIQKVDDGIMVELGEQAWLGVAASLGMSAIAAIRNPLSLLGRLDDIAQDIENLQISEHIWQVIGQTASAAGASSQLSDNLKRITCEYCLSANPVGESVCISCGAPLGNVQPKSCNNCGFVVKAGDKFCPNCNKPL